MKIKEFILRLIFPPKCIACGKVLPLDSDYPFICMACEKDLKKVRKRVCPTCLKPLDIADNVPYCPYCADNKYNFSYLVATCVYDGAIQKAIINLKFKSRPAISKSLAVMLYDRISNLENFKVDAICYAPISEKRFKTRRYNQSQLIANHLGNLMNLPVVELLEKIKETPKQSLLSEKERYENLKGAITYTRKSEYKSILLIDDVYTTGTTVKICCQELHKAGVRDIVCAVSAVTQKDIN